MAKLRGHAKQLASLQERPRKDYDPEAEPSSEHSQSDSESSDDALETQHYVSVGKSKLRQKEPVSLGPKYSGSRVSRAALEDESRSEPLGGESEDEDDEEDRENDSLYSADESDHGDDEEEGGHDGQEYAEPDTVDLDAENIIDDEEIDSDEALGESDKERFKKFVFRGSSKPRIANKGRVNRPVAAHWMGSSGQSSQSDDEDSEDSGAEAADKGISKGDEDVDMDAPEELDGYREVESDEDDIDDLEEDEDEDNDDSGDSEDEPSSEAMGTGASGAFSRGLKSTISRLSASAQKEAAQGIAFREHRKTFDSILNLRVRLQKSLVATNSLMVVDTSDANEEAYKAAEEAAIKLWNTVDSLRARINTDAYSKLNTKRKREADVSTSSEEIWENMAAVEKRAAALRKNNLEKWSEKANRGFISSSREAAKHTFKQTLTASLDGQLANPERLVKKTQIPRSCAPIQAKSKKTEDSCIYDDADFYQLLLKELLDQRTTGSTSANGGVTTIVYTAQREAKQKKIVDTKASKGRKMRFNVHEKLVAFMPCEDRRSWEKSAIDRLFGSLFGKKLVLDESDYSESDEEEGGTPVAEGSALRLFRSREPNLEEAYASV